MTTTIAPETQAATRAPYRPNALKLGLAQAVYEVRGFFRLPDAVFFNFAFPIMMFAIFATAFSGSLIGGGPNGEGGITAASYYLPAMLAAGLLLSGVQTLAIDIATERHDGTLRRFAGTPLPKLSYFIGKIGLVLITAVLQAAVLIAVAALFFGVELPTEMESWLTFAWVFPLGLAASAVIGIALSRLPRTARSASAVVVPPVLLLQFISGVYLPFTQLPEWLQNVAGIFPLRWMAQGLRSVFLPDAFKAVEQGGAWNLDMVAIVLGVWLVVGLVAATLTFRWLPKDR